MSSCKISPQRTQICDFATRPNKKKKSNITAWSVYVRVRFNSLEPYFHFSAWELVKVPKVVVAGEHLSITKGMFLALC